MTQRPPIGVVEQEYRAMMQEVHDALSAEYGVGAWVQHREDVVGFLCDDVENGVGRTLNLGSAGPVSDEDWPAALGAVEAIVAEHGFTELDRVVDEPGDHSVRISNPDGGYVNFGTKKATVLSVVTGCHPDDGGAPTGGAG